MPRYRVSVRASSEIHDVSEISIIAGRQSRSPKVWIYESPIAEGLSLDEQVRNLGPVLRNLTNSNASPQMELDIIVMAVPADLGSTIDISSDLLGWAASYGCAFIFDIYNPD